MVHETRFETDDQGNERFRGLLVERQRRTRCYSLAELPGEPVFEAWREYKLKWKKPGWKEESSEIISRVIQTEAGNLSGSCKLLAYGPHQDIVHEFYFGKTPLKPELTATYVLVGGMAGR